MFNQGGIYRCKVGKESIAKEVIILKDEHDVWNHPMSKLTPKELIILKDELDVWDHPMSKLRPTGIIKILTSLQCTLDLVMYFNQVDAKDRKQV